MEKLLHGELISLRPATLADKRNIFEWLAHSDLTSSMLGPPHFPENPVPTWEEFDRDYVDSFFDGSQPELGHSFVILAAGEAIGQINYGDLWPDRSTELDIWLSGSRHAGKGYGTDAIKTLCRYLEKERGCKKFFIAPSRKNTRAVNAYRKAGFTETTDIPPGLVPDYSDTIVLVKIAEA